MTDSWQLLGEYARKGSEAAFRELVTRYVDLVYSAAIRLVEADAHRAQDVAQTVFADLAHVAGSISREVMLGGWLHRHTCFVAANVMRGERRRQARERQAAQMNTTQDNSEADRALIAPILDDAVNELGEADRIAIETHALSAMDPNRPYRDNGQTIQDTLNQIAQERAASKEVVQQAQLLMPKMSNRDWVNFDNRRMLFGEVAADQWLVNKYGQH